MYTHICTHTHWFPWEASSVEESIVTKSISLACPVRAYIGILPDNYITLHMCALVMQMSKCDTQKQIELPQCPQNYFTTSCEWAKIFMKWFTHISVVEK